ncbi:family 10 glycosylhydrolase [Candidatus Parcubacteria bacterium]|nr:family 10 glycosylhydrolase [Candidatus Parcubacteria bacterium]
MDAKLKYQIIPITLIFIGVLLFGGYKFYQINQNLEVLKLEKIRQEKIAEEKITALKEKLAEQEIQNAFLEKEKPDPIEIAKRFNKEYAARKKVLELSNNTKGVYMTKLIANSRPQDLTARKILQDIKKLLDETELNAVVIDVKEVDGFELSDSLKKLIKELHKKDIWVIARFVAFRDSALIKERPELYLKKQDGALWQDEKGYFWLDPASSQVQKYLLDLCYEVIDFEFDEIQFDYIRFPAKDRGAVYPIYNKNDEKREAIRNFFLKIRNNLRAYKPDIILSVDLFGETATRFVSSEIGQDLADAVDIFDYVSFMLYPSHFFQGFQVGGVYFPYENEDITKVVSSNPYQVILRSIFSGSDYLSLSYSENKLQPQCPGKGFSFLFCPQAKIRPWLQDFDLKSDTSRGIFYDAEKIKAQIKAAEDSDASGWLIWDPSNIYTSTKKALKDEIIK